MKFPRLALLVLATLLPGLAAAAPGPVRKGAVTVELVARDDAIQPGRPFRVALRMDHEPHWHSYWIFAGTGYPTSLAWTLPKGFTAGPIEWALPHVVKDANGAVTGNGYEGTIHHFVTITPPADLAAGTSVTLKAAAEWLMCKESCVPGDAALELTLPVRDGPPGANAKVAPQFDAALAALPGPAEDWVLTATRTGGDVALRLAPAPGRTPAAPADLHYFDENGIIDYAAPQVLAADGKAWVLSLKVAADAPADAAGLKGVLSGRGLARNGGVTVSAAFNQPAASTAAAPAAPTPGASTGTPAGPAGPAAGPPAAGSLLGTLLLAFLGGLILNLMPCVFPVLGIKILGFVNQSGSDRAKVAAHGLTFAAGVLVSFWALAGLLLALRAGGAQLGWGFQLQSPAFVFGMAVFLLIFALNMSGLFEVGLSATAVGGNLQAKEGVAGSFFTGALATLVATPCSAPFLAPALGAALTLSAVESILVFTAIAVGLALPYLLLSLFPDAIKLLPRPGAWMETFKQFMAFPLYATVAWLLWVLAAQTRDDDYGLLLIAFGLVLVAMAGWAYGRFGQAFGKPARQNFGRVAAAALLGAGLWLGWPKSAEAAPAAPGTWQVAWQEWSPEAVAAAQAAGRPVYVDFTARWCATCQTNKAAVFGSADLKAEFGKRNFVLLRGDWTNRNARITAELARWGRSAVPFNLIYLPGRPEPVVLPELLTPGIVLDALAGAAK